MDRAMDLRLQELRGRTLHVDPLLAQLVNVCTRGGFVIQVGLVAVVGGVLIRGVPAETTAMSDPLDDDVRFFLDVLSRRVEEAGHEVSEIRKMADTFRLFGNTARTSATRRAEAHDRLKDLDEIPNRLHTLPDDLQDDALEVSFPPKAVTLERAQVRFPDGAWEDMGIVRVLLSQVGAWWTFRLADPDSSPSDEADADDDGE